MNCGDCSNWKSEALTYEELLERWEDSVGGMITTGLFQRYKKLANKQRKLICDVRVGFKYCSEGLLTRFYVRKGKNDNNPVKVVQNCQKFKNANGSIDFSKTSPLWRICTEETHGITKVKGISFAPGLYENHTYMRVPLLGAVHPRIINRGGKCSLCGKQSEKSISVGCEKVFCCNEHYLEWWSQNQEEDYRRLGLKD